VLPGANFVHLVSVGFVAGLPSPRVGRLCGLRLQGKHREGQDAHAMLRRRPGAVMGKE
jgi:hypothetical protein